MERNTLREQLAYWRFDGEAAFESGAAIAPELSILDNTPALVLLNQDIAKNGKKGVAYVDEHGIRHSSSRAAAWDDIKGKGPDAELHLQLCTAGWEQLRLRFDYRSDSADTVDVAYNYVPDGEWELIVVKYPLQPGYMWASTQIDFSEYTFLNNRQYIGLRLYNFDRNGNNRLVIDNVELTGVRVWGRTYPPRIIGLPRGISTVMNDPQRRDFTGEGGFIFHVSDPETPLDKLNITATSADEAVIAAINVVPLRAEAGVYRLEVGPPAGAVGVTEITVRVSDSIGQSATATLMYGASAFPAGGTPTYFTGSSNASAAVPITDEWMLVGDDEDNIIRLYPRHAPAGPAQTYRLTDHDVNQPPLYLPDAKKSGLLREMDIEDGVRLFNRAYWMCSHSNNNLGKPRPNRNRLFATDIQGEGTNISLQIVGYYGGLRDDLIAWGDAHGYDFTSATAEGKSSKLADGLNIEGFGLAPDGTTAMIGFRAPLVPVTDRKRALIALLPEFVRWFNNGRPVTAPKIGPPVELDLGGRGIRALKGGPHGCLIVAGPVGDDGTFALFTWSGHPNEAPQQRAANLSGTRPEVLVEMPSGPLTDATQVQLLSDNGTADWYNTGQESKDLISPLQKFRSDWVTLGPVVPTG